MTDYVVGLDVGSTFTSVAVTQLPDAATAAAPPSPEGSFSVAPAIAYYPVEGEPQFGGAARAAAALRPDLVVRGFMNRIGDAVPMVVGGRRVSAESIAAANVRSIIDGVAAEQGTAARRITIAHPASWNGHQLTSFREAVESAGVVDVAYVAAPVAALTLHIRAEDVVAGGTVAVYDLGGTTFDCAVVRTSPDGAVEPIGMPSRCDRLGGGDFDQPVFSHVRHVAHLSEPNRDDPAEVEAISRLRERCISAKEALSYDAVTTIQVDLPHRQTRVRLVRSEFEAMIADDVQETVSILAQTVELAGVDPGELSAVVLVGGSSQIPLVAQLLSERFDVAIVSHPQPDATVALGAAYCAAADAATMTSALPVSTALLTPATGDADSPVTVGPATRRQVARIPSVSRGRRGRASSTVPVLGGTAAAASSSQPSPAMPASATTVDDRPLPRDTGVSAGNGQRLSLRTVIRPSGDVRPTVGTPATVGAGADAEDVATGASTSGGPARHRQPRRFTWSAYSVFVVVAIIALVVNLTLLALKVAHSSDADRAPSPATVSDTSRAGATGPRGGQQATAGGAARNGVVDGQGVAVAAGSPAGDPAGAAGAAEDAELVAADPLDGSSDQGRSARDDGPGRKPSTTSASTSASSGTSTTTKPAEPGAAAPAVPAVASAAPAALPTVTAAAQPVSTSSTPAGSSATPAAPPVAAPAPTTAIEQAASTSTAAPAGTQEQPSADNSGPFALDVEPGATDTSSSDTSASETSVG